MPTSVLLAVLAAAGLLALAPALVRRYDATERLVAERAMSTARVLTRAGWQHPRRRRTIPGRRPVNPPRVLARQVTSAAAVAAGAAIFAVEALAHAPMGLPAGRGPGRPAAPRRSRPPPSADARSEVSADGRRGFRRTGAARFGGGRRAVSRTAGRGPIRTVPPAPNRGSWRCSPRHSRRGDAVAGAFGSACRDGFLLVAFVVHLRNRALTEQRERRAERHYAEWGLAAGRGAARTGPAGKARRELMERQLQAREEARRRGELRGPPTGPAVGG